MFKIVVVGDFGVGKTSLIMRFTERHFRDLYVPTIGVQFAVKEIEYKGEKYEFNIWDIAGQTAFRAVRSEFYQLAAAQILVYDVTRKESLTNLKEWHQEVMVNAGDVPAVVLGNKSDLGGERVVDREDAEMFVESMDLNRVISVMDTSAKTGDNVDKAFLLVASTLAQS